MVVLSTWLRFNRKFHCKFGEQLLKRISFHHPSHSIFHFTAYLYLLHVRAYYACAPHFRARTLGSPHSRKTVIYPYAGALAKRQGARRSTKFAVVAPSLTPLLVNYALVRLETL